ncbi:MAG TPA: NADH-quinone oxidoreductase subunit N [Thermomicrobiales bacterium]|jgi:NADH-quinone oxidoreductase subunit N|nr:NADH-quinone oxidoreductase subunit N [Thermomicrobiales bacterium]
MGLDLNLIAPDLSLAWPQVIVFVTAIVLLFADAFIPRAIHFTTLTAISLVGYIGAAFALFTQHGQNASTFSGAFRADGLTVFLSLTILVAAIATVMISASYLQNGEQVPGPNGELRIANRMPAGEFYVLIAFSVFGSMLVASAGNLIVLYIGIELSALATYVLTAFAKRRLTSVEGAMKYFLLGLFASGILLYGLAWIYGVTGSMDFDQIAFHLSRTGAGDGLGDPALLLGVLLLVVGIGFKMAAVPFHFWTPDAYDGAPTPVTAYMSVVPKAAAFAAAVRLFVQALEPLTDDWAVIWAVLAVITMAFGNIVAIAQRNVKRMLAYSSIAHTGYIMVGLAAYTRGGPIQDQAVSSLLFYLLAYTFMNIGAFAVVTWLQQRGMGMTLDDFNGLASTKPLVAFAMTIFMASLMGIPPLLGFYAKYYVIVAAIDADLLWLAVSVVVASAVSAFFYLRIVAVMYFNQADGAPRAVPTGMLSAGIGVLAVATLLLGLFSSPIIDLADAWSSAQTFLPEAAGR